MGLFTRLEPISQPPPQTEIRVDTHRSLALSALLEAIQEDRNYQVLDLGPAFGINVRFFSRFASKMRIEDLYATLNSAGFFRRNREEPVDASTFERILALPVEMRADIILAWDLLNYLTGDEIRGLMQYLSRFCSPGTLAFAICSTQKEIPARPTQFKIMDGETLEYLPGSAVMIPCPRYAPRDVTLLFSGFRVRNSYLLRNGLQEYLFIRE